MNVFGGKKDKPDKPDVNPDGIDIFLNYRSKLKIESNITISTKNFERKNTNPIFEEVDTKKYKKYK